MILHKNKQIYVVTTNHSKAIQRYHLNEKQDTLEWVRIIATNNINDKNPYSWTIKTNNGETPEWMERQYQYYINLLRKKLNELLCRFPQIIQKTN